MLSAKCHFVFIFGCFFEAVNPQFRGPTPKPVPEEKFKDIPVDFYLHICEEMDFTNAYFLVERESFSGEDVTTQMNNSKKIMSYILHFS